MATHAVNDPAQRRLLGSAGALAQLSFYPPGLRQPQHAHERTHLSIIIAGSIREVSGGRDETGYASALILRPYEVTHRVDFGPQGALILAVDMENHVARRATGWVHRRASSGQQSLVRWVLTQGVASNDDDIRETIEDLVAGLEDEPLRGSPPGWLIRAREHLTRDPATARIDALAHSAGVHRSHFARAFQHWFKDPPSLFRRRAMLSRAIAEVASGQGLASAAHTAGFADQSHLCRSMRTLLGTTPRRLLRQA